MPSNEETKPESTALRAFSVLEYVVRAGVPVSLDDATHACNLPKPTVFRILAMLQEADLLRREPLSKRYIVGARTSALAIDVMQHSTLRTQCHAVLQELVDEIGESSNLTMLDGNEVLYIDRAETPLPLRLHLEPGTRVPLHCTASGKIFLSQMSAKQIYRLLGKGPYRRYTDKTITDPHLLEQELKRTKRTLVGTHDSELFDASVAVGVPVTDQQGRVYAAVAIHAPTARMTIESCMTHVPTLRRAAEAIASILTPAKGLDRRAPGSRK
ncbi:IclR family transcriptional regulator [Trinickia mobilis]|uniref:IclR family transcriptional regulator n=1 Tax=Trinickia mobilis TaxID=2816356 RepID=UPI001A8D166E|nr:IclR family transcriptional regulator [Trinickia mobilis]